MGALGLAGVSWLDDLQGNLPVFLRLAAQVLAVGAGIASLPGDGLILQGTVPALVDHALAAAAWLWFVNLFNFMDGIDGLSGTEGASLGLGAFLLALLGAAPAWLGPLGLALAGVSIGFLLWNWHPAKIFLGDVGSIPLGYLSGWLMLALAAVGAWQAALLLPAYYLADATFTLVRRLLRGERVWQAHREHVYQRVVAAGWSHGRTAAVIAGHNLLLIGLAVASLRGWAAGAVAIAAGAMLVATLLWYLHAAARASCGASKRA
ncbi:MAG: glycosyl transferase [Rhodospirillaceae bacterium]|nr:glycosyl transferase [Rhodospirillaceae bacterium]